LIKDIDYSAQTVPEAIRPAEQTTQSSVSPLPTPVSASAGQSDQSVQLDQKLKDELSLRRQKANQVRSQKKAKHLDKIMELAKNTKSISNTDVQRLLHVSQSTATNYLAELARKGLLKRQGTRGGAKYTL
jgi:predicted HTH transcriptional regulator